MTMFSKPLIALAAVVVPVPGSSQLMCTQEQVDQYNEIMDALSTDDCLYRDPFSCFSPECLAWHNGILNAVNCPYCIIDDYAGTNPYEMCMYEAREEMGVAKSDFHGIDCGWVFDLPFHQ